MEVELPETFISSGKYYKMEKDLILYLVPEPLIENGNSIQGRGKPYRKYIYIYIVTITLLYVNLFKKKKVESSMITTRINLFFSPFVLFDTAKPLNRFKI